MTVAVNRYILLGYAATPEEEPTATKVVIWEESGADELKVSVSTGWLDALPSSTRGYVKALLEDWRLRRGRDATRLFLQLPTLSIGPLRFLKLGSCALRKASNVHRNYISEGSSTQALTFDRWED